MGYRVSVRAQPTNENSSCELYSNALATGTHFSHYWLGPARDLRLTLLCDRFDDGLEVQGNDLNHLASELDQLESYWIERGVGSSENVHFTTTNLDGSRGQGAVSMSEHLRERLGFLREAIRIARDSDGVLIIS